MASSPTQQEREKAYSQYELGLMYYNGTGGAGKDLNQAFAWINKASTNGSTEALNLLALMYSKGEGVEQDIEKAYELYDKSCKSGSAIGCEYYKKFNSKSNYREVLRQEQLKEKKQQDEQARLEQQREEQLQQRDQLLKENEYAKAYQAGLIDKDTARSEMLKRGQIIEAFEAGLIDKDTADLYLKKQAIDQQAKAARDQASAISNAAFDVQMSNSPNMLNQQLQNMQNYNQMNQMINQQNINNRMRK